MSQHSRKKRPRSQERDGGQRSFTDVIQPALSSCSLLPTPLSYTTGDRASLSNEGRLRPRLPVRGFPKSILLPWPRPVHDIPPSYHSSSFSIMISISQPRNYFCASCYLIPLYHPQSTGRSLLLATERSQKQDTSLF